MDRRNFVKRAAVALGTGTLVPPALSLGGIAACTEAEDQKLGIALVGLGYYSTNKLAPALQETQHCYLAGIVTGTPDKAVKWSEQYQIPKSHIYNYENFDSISDNDDVDIVYVVLPNAMHAEYSIRAAKAGKHVICEKPMAVSVAECEAMIQACENAGVKLQIGYRLQYEPHNKELMRLGQQEVLGPVKVIETSNAFYGVGGNNWRFSKALSGGGPLMDMGVYCIQGARYTLGEEPVAITAQTYKTFPDFFKDIEETLFWQMEFPSGAVANCMTSYAARAGRIHVSATEGSFGLEPAYGYGPLAGYIKSESMNIAHTNHQAVQMDAFATNIINDTPVIASGNEGLKDLRIIETIYEAMKNGKRLRL